MATTEAQPGRDWDHSLRDTVVLIYMAETCAKSQQGWLEGSVGLRLCIVSLIRLLCLLLAMESGLCPDASGAQVQAKPSALPPGPHPSAVPQSTGLSLNLCVQGSAMYPCPDPLLSDNKYTPAITLTYGQVLDGVVVYSPATLTFGTITLYKDAGSGPVSICVLEIGPTNACPAAATIFDVGDYTLTAELTFPGHPEYPTSSALPVTISVSKDTSAVAISSTQNPAALGTPVTLTATATGNYGAVPNGQVILSIDDMALAPIDLDASGVVSFTTSTLALGTHNVTASYAGARNFYPAADAPVFKQLIVPPATTTALASSLNPSAIGDKVTFTATLGTAAGFMGTPSGSMTFKDGNVSFGAAPVTLRAGQFQAQTSVSTLAAGSHSITATYSGDGSTSPSVSPVLVQQVNYPLAQAPPGYRVTVSPSPVALGVGQTVNLIVEVIPISGFSQPVTLSCSDLPNEAACTFADAVIPSGGGSTTLAFSTMAPHDCGSNIPYFTGQAALHGPVSPRLRYASPLLAGVLLLLLQRRRRASRWIRPLLALAFVCGLLAINGCGGNCTDFGTSPGSYTFKVNGTAPGSTPATGTGSSTVTAPGAINVSTSVAISVKL